jgi:hypothetical protein
MAKIYSDKHCSLCGGPVVARGLCGKHYMRYVRHGDAEHVDRPHDWGTKSHVVFRRDLLKASVYEKLFEKQKGVCAICGLPEKAKHQNGVVKKLSIDHCHTTGKIRALLCNSCNRGIGILNEDVKILESAIKYLQYHGNYSDHDVNLEVPEQQIMRCSVDGCNRIHDAHGFCVRHAKQLRAGHDPHEKNKCLHCDKEIQNAVRNSKFCSISCKMKYHRAEGCYTKESQVDNRKCERSGCDRAHHAKGLCRKHFMQKWHEENPNAVAYKKGEKMPQRIRDKFSNAVRETTTGVEFTSMSNAVEYYGFLMPTLVRALQSGKPITKGDKRGLQFIYADSVNKAAANPNLHGERYAAPVIDYTHCSIEGCDNPHKAKGFCMYHYKQNRKSA